MGALRERYTGLEERFNFLKFVINMRSLKLFGRCFNLAQEYEIPNIRSEIHVFTGLLQLLYICIEVVFHLLIKLHHSVLILACQIMNLCAATLLASSYFEQVETVQGFNALDQSFLFEVSC